MGERITLEWRSFLLRVEPKTTDRDSFVDYTRSWLRPAELEPEARFTVWASDSPPPSSSLPAQVAYKTMELLHPEAVHDYHRALLTAYFTDNRDISAWGVLTAVATEVGVDGGGFAAGLDEHNQAMTRLVIDDHNAAIEDGITAVPTVVINGLMPVPGAQEVDAYQRWIERIAAIRSSD